MSAQFDLPLRKGIHYYKQFHLMSTMLHGKCDGCKYFWNSKIEPHVGSENSYEDLDSWARETSCNTNKKKHNKTMQLDDDQWTENELKHFIENCDLGWTDIK